MNIMIHTFILSTLFVQNIAKWKAVDTYNTTDLPLYYRWEVLCRCKESVLVNI